MTSQITTRQKVEAGLARRRRKESLFRATGILATAVGILFLVVFFATLIVKGSSAFVQTFVQLDLYVDAELIAPGGELDPVYGDFDGIVRAALRKEFPAASGRSERRELYRLVSLGAGYQLRDQVVQDPTLIGTTVSLLVPAA